MTNKLRIIIKTDNKDKTYNQLCDIMLEHGFKITDFTINVTSFNEYMKAIFERRDFKSDVDIEFLYTDEEINSNLTHFHECWENGMSPYKALTFLGV